MSIALLVFGLCLPAAQPDPTAIEIVGHRGASHDASENTVARVRLAREQGADANGDVRVMSFNIRYANPNDGENAWEHRKDFLVETIRAFDPDLLGTQETLPTQRDHLVASLPGYEVLAAGRDDGREQGEMTALFFREARFAKLDGGHFWLSETPDRPGSKSWDTSLTRMATWVKLRDRTDPDAPPIAFINTHFDHRGVRARLESARLLRRKVGEIAEGCRVVLTGDFNSPEGSDPYRALFAPGGPTSSTLLDTFRVAHPSPREGEGTFSHFQAGPSRGGRIDWIACSTAWGVRAAGIDHTRRDGRTPSDHFPVTAVLRPIPSDTSARVTLRILSYNIHHGEGADGKVDLPRLAGVIRSARPDLVALQEVDRGTRRSGNVDQAAELARLTGLHAAFGKAIDHDGGAYGQAILARVPIADLAVHILPGDPDRERRIAVEARLELGGRPLRFVSTHLDHQIADARAEQAARINDLLADSDRPVILAGDLNATPESTPLAILARNWSVANDDRSRFTSPASRPARTIDYVLYRPSDGVRVVDQAVIDEPVASDHRPVLVVLEFRPD